MKIEIKESQGRHVNPNLCGGRVYQNHDNKQFYLGCESIFDGMAVIILVNLETGIRWNGSGGFGTGRFIDVTEISTFVVEI